MELKGKIAAALAATGIIILSPSVAEASVASFNYGKNLGHNQGYYTKNFNAKKGGIADGQCDAWYIDSGNAHFVDQAVRLFNAKTGKQLGHTQYRGPHYVNCSTSYAYWTVPTSTYFVLVTVLNAHDDITYLVNGTIYYSK